MILQLKGEKLHPGHSFTIMQNFTLIAGTIAEISVSGQRKRITAYLIYDKMLY